jgi:Zn-finger protein
LLVIKKNSFPAHFSDSFFNICDCYCTLYILYNVRTAYCIQYFKGK